MTSDGVSAFGSSSLPLPPFRAGGEFTVGVEDELHVVDAGGELDGGVDELIARVNRGLGSAGSAAREIFASQVEFNTPACRDASALGEHLAGCRSALVDAGRLAIGTGVHPSAPLGRFARTSSPRYDALATEFAGVLRTPTAAFQVHVGMPDEVSLLAAYRGIRNSLAVLRALAASSPFWHGRDSGLASSRAAIIRSYPRVGVPPVLGSYDEYAATVGEEMRATEVPDYTYVCWEVRPHPRFGTLEVRVMDAQPSLERAVGLVALVQGMARFSVENPTVVDLPAHVMAANDFRASRYGLDTRVVDAGGRLRAVRDLAVEAIGHARSAMAPEMDRDPLDALESYLRQEPEYQRHRRIHAQHGMPGLLADLAERTLARTHRPAQATPTGRRTEAV